MVIKNRLRFFLFFFFFVSVLFLSVRACVKTKKPSYVEVDADKVDPIPKEVENSDSLVNFIEEVKKTKAEEERELSLKEIEAKELEEQKENRLRAANELQEKKRRQKNALALKLKERKRAQEKARRSLSSAKSAYNKNFLKQITVSGGEQSLNGLSRARLESYSNKLRASKASKVYITGFFRRGESKAEGFRRAEQVKRVLIGSGVRDKAMYVSSKQSNQSSSNENFNWSSILAK